MEEGRGKATVAKGDVKKTGKEIAIDAVQTCVGAAGVGGAASPRAGSPVTATVDLEEKKVVVSDSAVPELGVTASSCASHGPAEAGGEHVDLQDKKRKLDMTGFCDPYDPDYDDDEPYEYHSDDDVDKGNIESFIAKEVEKIKAKGSSLYTKGKKFVCPYYTTKRKPEDGLYDRLISHARDASIDSDDYKVRGQHGALLKALYPN